MKYWWLENYKDFKIIQITELAKDINYFLTMPKNYDKRFLLIKEKDFDELEEEELVILLKKIVDSKNIKDGTLSKIINKLLLIPDNSFPATDYSFEDMIEEVKHLRKNRPFYDKIECSNVAACYNCLNVFYVDKIKGVNKNNLCLCPFCSSTKLYFDCDYIPMNYLFIRLAYLYYNTSRLGCTFRELKKILKKDVKVGSNFMTYDDDLTELLSGSKTTAIDEKIISKKVYDLLIKKENNFDREITFNIDIVEKDVLTKLLIILLMVVYTLSNTFSLKKVLINIRDKDTYLSTKSLIKTLLDN